MKPVNPVYAQAISAATLIAVVKAFVSLMIAFHLLTVDDSQNKVLSDFIDTVVPIVAVLGGAMWAARKVTPLAAPRDIDGAPLTRPDNSPAIPELVQAHEDAIKINEKVDIQSEKDERRILRK